MPELPEVETVRRALQGKTANTKLRDITIHDGHLRYPVPDLSVLANSMLENWERKGKYLCAHFDNGYSLLVHLGMTGGFFFKMPDKYQRHLKITFHFSKNLFLHYCDIRRFSFLKLFFTHVPGGLANRQAAVVDLARLGDDALLGKSDHKILYAKFQKSRAPIQNLLLSQKILSGIGNIYMQEILFKARVLPSRPANQLTENETKRISEATREILTAATKKKGSTISDFYYANGESGKYQNFFLVYGRAKLPCKICGKEILSEKNGGRRTSFCANCQK